MVQRIKMIIYDPNEKFEDGQWTLNKMFGDKEDEYNIYLSCADDGTGHEIMTGEPLKTYDEWLNN